MRAFAQRLLMVFWILSGLACQPRAAAATETGIPGTPFVTVQGQRAYEVHQRLTLINEGPGQPEKQNLWVALIRNFSPY